MWIFYDETTVSGKTGEIQFQLVNYSIKHQANVFEFKVIAHLIAFPFFFYRIAIRTCISYKINVRINWLNFTFSKCFLCGWIFAKGEHFFTATGKHIVWFECKSRLELWFRKKLSDIWAWYLIYPEYKRLKNHRSYDFHTITWFKLHFNRLIDANMDKSFPLCTLILPIWHRWT